MMITREQAEALAGELVSSLGAASGDEFAVVPEKTVEIDKGWVFFYNSCEFIETGNVIAALAGNGPIFVNRDGEMTTLPTAIPWKEAIESL